MDAIAIQLETLIRSWERERDELIDSQEGYYDYKRGYTEALDRCVQALKMITLNT